MFSLAIASLLGEHVPDTTLTLANDVQFCDSFQVKGSMMIQYEAILRNKRCVLAYLMERVRRLQMLRWDVGAVLPPELRESLSVQEVNYLPSHLSLPLLQL